MDKDCNVCKIGRHLGEGESVRYMRREQMIIGLAKPIVRVSSYCQAELGGWRDE